MPYTLQIASCSLTPYVLMWHCLGHSRLTQGNLYSVVPLPSQCHEQLVFLLTLWLGSGVEFGSHIGVIVPPFCCRALLPWLPWHRTVELYQDPGTGTGPGFKADQCLAQQHCVRSIWSWYNAPNTHTFALVTGKYMLDIRVLVALGCSCAAVFQTV